MYSPWGGDGIATAAYFDVPRGVAADMDGNTYIVDENHFTVWKVDPFGRLIQIAGTGASGYSGDGGPASLAALSYPYAVALDAFGNVYIGGYTSIRKINTSGVISTFAGGTSTGYSGDGGPATAARFNDITGLCFDKHGSLFVSDGGSNRVRKINPSGIISTVAGSTYTTGFYGDGGQATAATFNGLLGIAVDSADNLYITDANNQRVRKVDTSGIIRTIAGGYGTSPTDSVAATASGLNSPRGVAVDGLYNIYIADNVNGRIRKVDTSGIITTVASPSYAYHPNSVAVDFLGNIYYSETDYGIIKKISVGTPPPPRSGPSIVSVGGSITLTYPTSGGSWRSSDTTLARVSSGGVVSGISIGNLVISYTVSNSCGTSVFTHPVGVGAATYGCYTIATIAGSSTTSGFGGDGGAATAAMLNLPSGVATDRAGNIYVADNSNNRIRKITPSGIISTFAGTGSAGLSGDGSAATAAQLNNPQKVKVDATGNVYIADYGNHRIRKVNTSGVISTVAGSTAGFSGDGGRATAAKLNGPNDVAIDGSGNLYISDYSNSRVRKVSTSGTISTFAGGSSGLDGGPATAAFLNGTNAVAADRNGNVFIAEALSSRIRKVNTSGTISTYVGNGTSGYDGDGGLATATRIEHATSLFVDSNLNLYFTDAANYRVRKVTPEGYISCIAGSSSGFSGDGGTATAALFNAPNSVWLDSAGNMFITDLYNNRVRKVNAGPPPISTISGAGLVESTRTIMLTNSVGGGYWTSSNPAVATINSHGVVTGVSVGNDTIFYTYNYTCGNQVAKKPVSVISSFNDCNLITTVAGNGEGSYSGDGGQATSATVNGPGAIAQDTDGNIYFADATNQRVRKINLTTGIITTVAGNGTAGFSGDGGAATNAQLNGPSSISLDFSGNIYIADYNNHRIRKVNSRGIISTFAGTGTAGSTGDYGPATAATLNYPTAVAWEFSTGNVVISDLYSHKIRKVYTTGTIVTIAGTGTSGSSGDGGPATDATLSYAGSFIFDNSSNLYFSDVANQTIRKIGSSGLISKVAGSGAYGFAGDGGPATDAQFKSPYGLAMDTAGNIYIADYVNAHVRMVNRSGTITSIAGFDEYTYAFNGDGIAAIHAALAPRGVLFDNDNHIYVTDASNNRIRKINPGLYLTVQPISGPSLVCTGATISLADSTIGGTWSCSDTSAATVSTSGVVTGIGPGSVTITYAISSSCGTVVATKSIVISSGGYVGAISGPSTVCTSATISLTDSTTGGTWSSSNASLATVSTTGVVTGIAIGSVTISYAATGGCGAAVATKTITVSSTPYVASISGASAVCVGATTTFTDATTGGTWSSSNTAIASVTSGGVVRGLAAGTATISYSISGTCGTANATATITVNATPSTPALITGTTTICNGTNTTLADATSGGTWSSSNTAIASINSSGTVYGIAVGSVIISYTVTNSCGVAARTASFTVSNSASAGTISGASSVCTGVSTTFTNTASGGTWSSSNASIATVNTSGIVTGVTAGIATISYTVTAACGSVVATKVITVNLSANAGTISGSATACAGTTAVMTNSATGGTWSSSSTTIATISSTGIVTPIAAGTVNISYTVSNTCGTAVATKTVTVNAGPVAGTLTGSSNVCAALSITITPSVTGGTWSSSNTSVASVSSTGAVTGISPGSVTISYSVSNTCGTAVAGKVITVGSLPTAGTLSGATSLCTGATTTIASTVSGGSWLTSNTAIATIVAATGILRGVTAGTVTVSYYVSSTCATAIATRNVTISASASAGSILGLNSVCAGSSTTFTDAASGGTWSSSNTSVASVTTTGGVVGIAAGSATITYTVASGCGSAYATKAIAVNPRPTVGPISGPTSVCAGSTITLTDPVSGGGWISSTTSVATVSAAGVVTAITAGTTAITYFVSNSCGTSTAARNVTVSTLSAGTLSGLSTVALGASIILTASSSGGTWTSLNTSLATVSATGTVRAIAAGTDTIKYTVTGSCGTASVTKVINITSHREMTGPAGTTNDETGSINIYPNPSNGAFTLVIDQDMETATVVITDVTGKVVETRTGNEKAMYFVLNNVAAGAYLVQIEADGKHYVRKIIVQ